MAFWFYYKLCLKDWLIGAFVKAFLSCQEMENRDLKKDLNKYISFNKNVSIDFGATGPSDRHQ